MTVLPFRRPKPYGVPADLVEHMVNTHGRACVLAERRRAVPPSVVAAGVERARLYRWLADELETAARDLEDRT